MEIVFRDFVGVIILEGVNVSFGEEVFDFVYVFVKLMGVTDFVQVSSSETVSERLKEEDAENEGVNRLLEYDRDGVGGGVRVLENVAETEVDLESDFETEADTEKDFDFDFD